MLKKLIVPAVAMFMMLALLFAEVSLTDNAASRYLLTLLTDGTATYTARTVTYNGFYGPRNAGVIWVTDADNNFVKTIKVWANTYRYTLVRWIANSSQNMVGAITSASLNNHQLHNVQWNGKNWQNQDMPDGTYKINIEFTEHNASTANLGKYKQIVFTKGTEPVTLTLPNESYFQNLSLSWAPVIVNGTLSGTVTNTSSIPIEGATISANSASATTNAQGQYSLSLPAATYSVSCSAAGYQDYSLADVAIVAGQTTTLNISMGAVANLDETESSPNAMSSRVYPNPTHSPSQMQFFTKSKERYTFRVFDLRGRIVRTITGVSAEKSQNRLTWDLLDSNGLPCPNGRYILQLDTGDKTYTHKLMISK